MTRDIKYPYHYYMDPKKQDLTPELKQIYDRVMNTQVAGKTPAGLNSAPDTPISSTPPTNTQSQSAATPLVNPTISQPGTTQESVSQPFLSSVPPRPIADTSHLFLRVKKLKPQVPYRKETRYRQTVARRCQEKLSRFQLEL